jgi:hypothetical protein
MLGVAAEAAFMELSPAFAKRLEGIPGEKLTEVLNSRRHYIHKFIEFRKRLDQEKSNLPEHLWDGRDLLMNSVGSSPNL